MILALLFMIACGFTATDVLAEPDVPLVFLLQDGQGNTSCLIAINHLVVQAAIESDLILDCERRAKAVILESDITEGNLFTWEGFKSGPGDPTINSLTPTTSKKIIPALRAAGYDERQIEYFRTLHPIAIYRALQYSNLLSPGVSLVANIDIQLAIIAKTKKIEIREAEGMPEYYRKERSIEIQKIDDLISIMCDMILDSRRTEEYKRAAYKYLTNLSAQPDIDTAWKKKLALNTQAMHLPDYSMQLDVDDRNQLIAKNIVEITKSIGPTLSFVGASHVGGPSSILKFLEKSGIQVKRLQ